MTPSLRIGAGVGNRCGFGRLALGIWGSFLTNNPERGNLLSDSLKFVYDFQLAKHVSRYYELQVRAAVTI